MCGEKKERKKVACILLLHILPQLLMQIFQLNVLTSVFSVYIKSLQTSSHYDAF